MNRYVRAHGRSFSIPTFGPAICDDPAERLAIALVVTSEPHRRPGFLVRYNIEPGAVDLGLAQAGRAPVMMDHKRTVTDMLGAVVKVWRDEAGLLAMLRFAKGGEADRVWDLLQQGFPLSVSVGGHILDMREIDREDARAGDDAEFMIERWRLQEVSVCLV